MFGQERNLWNPWRELDRFQNEVNRLFATSGREVFAQTPRINVWTSEEGAVVTALLPGLSAENLDISVMGETLTLRGQRTVAPLQQGEGYHRRERTTGEFARTVELPFRVDAQKVVASCNRGVLEVMLPRASEDKPKRIAVQAG